MRHLNRNEAKIFIFFLNFEYWNFVVSKKVNFSNPPILNIFFTKISGNGPWVLRRNSWIGQGCRSSIWLSGCPTKGHFRAKNTKNAFSPLKLPFVGQPDNHIVELHSWPIHEFLLLNQGPFLKILVRSLFETEQFECNLIPPEGRGICFITVFAQCLRSVNI